MIQVDGIDSPTRTAIWNWFLSEPLGHLSPHRGLWDTSDGDVVRIRKVWADHFGGALDDLNNKHWYELRPKFRELVENGKWFDVYDFLQEVVEGFEDDELYLAELQDSLNEVLKKYICGYQMVAGLIVPLTGEAELDALTKSLNDPSIAVAEHFRTALDLMADRQTPDFRNSIKESISAVEAMAREVSGKPKATLADAIKALKAKHPIHAALEKAIQSLYGFAGDESGIRHALTEDASTVDLADAKFMLVACSAFCNFLREATSTRAKR